MTGLVIKTCYDSDKNAENLRQYKIKFSVIVEQIPAFALSLDIVREVKFCPEILNKLRDNVLSY